MKLRAYWQFYKSMLPFIASFAIISIVIFGLAWGFALFTTVGLIVGFFGFETFRKKEYYFYYNLGITKWMLFKTCFIINLILGIPVFFVLLTFFIIFFGQLTIT